MPRHAATEPGASAPRAAGPRSGGQVLARLRGVRHLRASFWIFVGVLLVYLATGTYDIMVSTNDVTYVALPAWRIGQFHDINLDGYLYFGHPWQLIHADHIRSDRFPGAILFAAPFYAVGGSQTFSIVPSVWSAAVASAAAITFLHRTLITLVPPVTALGATLLAAFGTSMWTVAGHSAWTEGPTILGLAIGTWAMTKAWYATAGLGYAFAILSRPHAAVVPAVVGLWESIVTRRIRPALTIAATSVLGVAGLLAWNHVNAGRWALVTGSYSGRAAGAVGTGPHGQATLERWAGSVSAVLASPLRGVLVLSPFLLLLLPGLRAAWRVAPAWVRSSSVAGLVFLVVQLAGNTYTGGYGFFGYRVTLGALFLNAPLLTLAWQSWTARAAWRRWIFGVLAVASVAWFVGAAKYFVPVPHETPAWSDSAVPRVVHAAGASGIVGCAIFVVVLLWILRAYARNLAAGEPAPAGPPETPKPPRAADRIA